METKTKELAKETASLKDLRSFGILMGSVFSIVSLVLLLKGSKWWLYSFVGGAFLFFVLAFFVPLWLSSFYRKWMQFAELIATFNMKLILGLIYISCFSSLGLIFRLIGKDPMKRKFDPKAKSYWVNHEVPESSGGLNRYEQQY